MELAMIEKFLHYIEHEKRYSKHTFQAYNTDLIQLKDFLSSTFELNTPSQASFQMLRSWIVSLMDSGVTARSVNRKIACIPGR